MSEKTYVNGIFLKEKTFNNGGSILNASINYVKFMEELQKHVNDKGYVNIQFCKRKSTDDKGNTHYAVLNTYTPNNSNVSVENPEIEDDIF